MSTDLIHDYHRWLNFQRQAQLDREHRGAISQLDKTGASSSRMIEAYRSMAEKAASERACYRTLFQRAYADGHHATCEGWLFVRRVLAEEGKTLVRATLMTTFTLTDGVMTADKAPVEKITLELFDQLKVSSGIASVVRVDRVDRSGDVQFIALLDNARADSDRQMS
ncbi:hypothetical protein [Halomonas halocynthiae]|uniref:hypothetical protein n=1 Tax=Halomonas halocynthiae TaxID=176290 RepID=UPI000416C57F|nr:hypothetical protein [Halomonas halocynthiae]